MKSRVLLSAWLEGVSVEGSSHICFSDNAELCHQGDFVFSVFHIRCSLKKKNRTKKKGYLGLLLLLQNIKYFY